MVLEKVNMVCLFENNGMIKMWINIYLLGFGIYVN